MAQSLFHAPADMVHAQLRSESLVTVLVTRFKSFVITESIVWENLYSLTTTESSCLYGVFQLEAIHAKTVEKVS